MNDSQLLLRQALEQASLPALMKQLALPENTAGLTPVNSLRVCILRNHTVDNIQLFLRGYARLQGIALECELAPFDQLLNIVLDKSSLLHQKPPDIIILSLVLETFTSGDLNFAPADVTERLLEIASALEADTNAIVVMNTFLLPAELSKGILTPKHPQALEQKIKVLNDWIAAWVAGHNRFFMVDFAAIEARLSTAAARDLRMWYLAKSILSNRFLKEYAFEISKMMAALKGRAKKCLVLDADNTLWGGIVGEDGVDHLRLSADGYPGNIFYQFQRVVLDLQERGVLLVLCSKNNEADVWEVLDNHPECLIKKKHLAAWRINWQDKASNIKELAQELNIGLDSMVFIDDSPTECALVSESLPDVCVQMVPKELWNLPSLLLKEGLFDTLAISAEDAKRTQMYQAQAERNQTAKLFKNPEEFLASLDLKITIKPVASPDVPRAAQLTQKTNQFNLTTRRYSEAQLAAMINSSDHEVLMVNVSDRFGDFGMVGVAILRYDGVRAEVDTFLLSCRVLGRKVEDVFLQHCLKHAKGRGMTQVLGVYIPTLKNEQTSSFFTRMGFNTMPHESKEQQFLLALAEYQWVEFPYLTIQDA